MNSIIVVIICIIVIIVSIIVNRYLLTKNFNEKFGYYCKNCNRNNWMGESDCAMCSNCGWCINPDGYGSCGIGDQQVQFKDCQSWYYQGQCMWGPACNYQGPIYITQPPVYNHWYMWPFRWWRRTRRRK